MPGFLLRYIRRVIHEKDINDVMSKIGHTQGLDFVEGTMKCLDLTIVLKGEENIPKEGGCILAANHPLGGLDGIAFMKAVGEVREDLQFLVNDILLSIENLKGLFVPVNKVGDNPRAASKLIEKTYSAEIPVMVFPSGLVSRKLPEGIADLEWKKSFIKKSIQYKKDIIPVHIDGRNSNFFYNLSRLRAKLGIKANIEMFYLPKEMFRQRGKTLTIRFGKPIPYQSLDKSKTLQEWAADIRAKVYELPKKQ